VTNDSLAELCCGILEFKFEGVSLETARSMVAMMDVSFSVLFYSSNTSK